MSTCLLEQKNPHPRDLNITFEPIAHKYTIKPSVYAITYNDVPYISVTTWLHSHFAQFDADAIISGMMASSKWPLSQYYGKTREQIKMEWETSRDEAARAGTELHYMIEMYYNGGAVPTGPRPPYDNMVCDGNACDGMNEHSLCQHTGVWGKIPHFMNYVKGHAAHFVPYRTEWMVYDEKVRIAGSIDMVYLDPAGTDSCTDNNSVMIYDWKRTKEIKKTTGFNKYSTTDCINHLPDTNFWHYALQLNIYKAILERNYNKKVTSMMLVCLHPNNKNGDYLLFKVPDLQAEIHDLFELRLQQISFM